jgi:hypothetical protein
MNDKFSFRFVITLHAVVFGLFAVYLVAGHHWSAGVISENRLAEVKDQLAGTRGTLVSCCAGAVLAGVRVRVCPCALRR